MWRNVILKLAERNTVIAPDMRGYCGSTRVTEWFDQRQVGEDIRLLMEGQGFTTLPRLASTLARTLLFTSLLHIRITFKSWCCWIPLCPDLRRGRR